MKSNTTLTSSVSQHERFSPNLHLEIIGEKMTEYNKRPKKSNTYLQLYTNFFNSSKTLIDFGIGIGKEEEVLSSDWKIIGYDKCDVAKTVIETNPNKQNILYRQLDFNQLDDEKVFSHFQKNMTNDLSKVCNIISIHLFEYLKRDAITLLLFSIINLAKSGSIFLFVHRDILLSSNSKTLTMAEAEDKFIDPDDVRGGLLRSNYLHSFFGGRTDMICLLKKRFKATDAGTFISSDDKNATSYATETEDIGDEVLIFKKL